MQPSVKTKRVMNFFAYYINSNSLPFDYGMANANITVAKTVGVLKQMCLLHLNLQPLPSSLRSVPPPDLYMGIRKR